MTDADARRDRFEARVLAAFEGRFPGAVRVKSFAPVAGDYGPEWPALVVDCGGERATVRPCWDRESELGRLLVEMLEILRERGRQR